MPFYDAVIKVPEGAGIPENAGWQLVHNFIMAFNAYDEASAERQVVPEKAAQLRSSILFARKASMKVHVLSIHWRGCDVQGRCAVDVRRDVSAMPDFDLGQKYNPIFTSHGQDGQQLTGTRFTLVESRGVVLIEDWAPGVFEQPAPGG